MGSKGTKQCVSVCFMGGLDVIFTVMLVIVYCSIKAQFSHICKLHAQSGDGIISKCHHNIMTKFF